MSDVSVGEVVFHFLIFLTKFSAAILSVLRDSMNVVFDQFDLIGHAAIRLARQLREQDCRIVFAESCTAGLVAASLARVPGISNWMCGSAVTYQEQIKKDWLGVSAADLQQYSAVSSVVTRQMATKVLEKTAPAMIAAAVTGHLGPDAPPGLDGVGFIAVAVRESGCVTCEEIRQFHMARSERVARQFEAAQLVLEYVSEVIAERRKTKTGSPGGTA